MKIIEVTDKLTRRQFLQVPKELYRNDPHWVCPLDNTIEGIFDPARNTAFMRGEAMRWILTDQKGRLTGRIAAFIDRARAKEYPQPVGGIGFFECIDDQEAAGMLFDVSREWLVTRGMKAMDGPINFGENNNHWGLLVKGFMQQGFGMPYNFPYYQKLFENYGFRNYFEQYSYHRDLTVVLSFPERFEKIVEWVSRKPGYDYRHFSYREAEKYVNDMISIYNKTWSSYKDDYVPLEQAEVYKVLEEAKAVVDEELIWFVYYKDEAVAFYVLFPDLNQILKHLDGHMHLINMLKFLYLKRKHTMTRIRAFLAGVLPQYQNIGLETVIFRKLFEVFRRKKYYRELELSWVGDYNPRMRSIYEAIGAQHVKTHITYRYMFDKQAPFKRYIDEVGYMISKPAATKERKV